MSTERPPPPDGRLLFRFELPATTGRQRAHWDACREYAVTSWEDDGSGWCQPPDHCRIIIWGWLGWARPDHPEDKEHGGHWYANINARPVVFELMRMARDAGRFADDLILPGERGR